MWMCIFLQGFFHRVHPLIVFPSPRRVPSCDPWCLMTFFSQIHERRFHSWQAHRNNISWQNRALKTVSPRGLFFLDDCWCSHVIHHNIHNEDVTESIWMIFIRLDLLVSKTNSHMIHGSGMFSYSCSWCLFFGIHLYVNAPWLHVSGMFVAEVKSRCVFFDKMLRPDFELWPNPSRVPVRFVWSPW